MAYCTVDEARDRMGHEYASSVNLDARLAAAIDAVTLQIESDTGRVFAQVTEARTFRVDDANELHVPDFVSVSALKIDDDDDGVFETTITSSGYELDRPGDRAGWPYSIIRLSDRSFPSGGRRQRRVEVTAVWGWSAVPAPINQACSLMAARISQRASTALYGTQSFGDLGAAGIRSTDPDYARLIAPYTRPQVA